MNTLTNAQNRTAVKLAEMFTENTGRSFLDSGDAYGRNWEKNQGLTVSHFLDLKRATWERDYGATLNSFSFCNDRLNYTKTAEVLTRLFYVWELRDYENRNIFSLSDQEDYLEHLGAEMVNGFNTYNFDTLLGQILQGFDFQLMGQTFVLLQVHGGCDARGGYTRPVVFESCCQYWLHGSTECIFSCDACEIVGNSYDPIEWQKVGRLEPTLFGEPERYFSAPEGYSLENGCPSCGGELTAELVECGW